MRRIGNQRSKALTLGVPEAPGDVARVRADADVPVDIGLY
jgi:hypothetical protein